MDISFFANKSRQPFEVELENALADNYRYWIELRNFVFEKYPAAKEEWNFPGKKYGWSFRIKDKKRAIIYLLPRDGFFKVAFVFGGKAMQQILELDIDEQIKTDLKNAKVYAEGRGINIPVTDDTNIADIKKLVIVKLAF